MGTISTLLAIAVVLGHTGSNYVFVKPYIAVEMFYVARALQNEIVVLRAGHRKEIYKRK